MSETGKKAKGMGRGNILMLMVIHMMVIGKMIR
jgi:hypothetical protein